MVETGTAATKGAAAGDDWPSRLAKYIPTESATLFSTLNATLKDEFIRLYPKAEFDLTRPVHSLPVWLWAAVILVGCLIFNILYLHSIYVKRIPQPLIRRKVEIPHITVSSIGFACWVYVTRSPLCEDIYISFVAYLVAALFTAATYRVRPIISLDEATETGLATSNG